ncbi:MAG TPA: hypothetical protein VFR33_00855 [Candidatus Dormibacteraeota bacterium]|nr:hypothetical protein [Candidatus Dormibacteraeota bacterium]
MAAAGAAIVSGVAGVAGLAFLSFAEPANHPQTEMARSAVSQLESGASPRTVVPSRVVDIGTSTDPYVIVTDSHHNVVASSASLSGALVLPPPGVFDSVLKNGEDKLTWQPTPSVRTWIVVDSYKAGFVIAGRSPSHGEQSEYLIVLWASVAAITLAAVGGVTLFISRLRAF